MAICFTVLCSGMAFAVVPSLQLDIANGVYDTTTATTVATTNPFTLNALLDPTDSNTLGGQYYISIAVIPQTSTIPAPDLGSIVFAGETIDVTGDDMVYGTAPLEVVNSLQVYDDGDLPEHGIFPTYFIELAFNFSGSHVDAYNTATGESGAPGSLLYNADFLVDVSKLNAGYKVHFDLYNSYLHDTIINYDPTVTLPDVDIVSYAPFNHDAESGWPSFCP